MKVHTLTAIAGGDACNAKCPYCVSEMTPKCGVGPKSNGVNLRNFKIACAFAERCGVSTLLITGKGEPLLYLADVNKYLAQAQGQFPFLELQTNGILLIPGESNGVSDAVLREWYDLGLTTVSVSIAHYAVGMNAAVFRPDKPYDFWAAVERLHTAGFAVRVNCTLLHGFVDTVEEVRSLKDVCQLRGVEQLTVREVSRPAKAHLGPGKQAVSAWNSAGALSTEGLCERVLAENKAGLVELLDLPHGGKVLDWGGQNICLANCLTETKDPEDIRQLIYFPDGRLRYSWNHAGAIIL